MSCKYEDHNEYAPTEAEFDSACRLISEVSDIKIDIVLKLRGFMHDRNIPIVSKKFQIFSELVDEVVNELLSDYLKEAREITDGFDDGYASQNRLQANQLL